MTFIEFLIKTYGYNEPIFSSDIEFKNYSKAWINKELTRLCTENQLIRYDKGVYYVPRKTELGLSRINPQKIIEKKYIRNGANVFGYYTGQTFLNQLGISTQVPNIIEICTNNESSKVRDITVGQRKLRLRRQRIYIDSSNEKVLSFLELMNSIDAKYIDDERKKLLVDYIKSNGITKEDITKYSSAFPDKAIRTMVESEVIYSVAQ